MDGLILTFRASIHIKNSNLADIRNRIFFVLFVLLFTPFFCATETNLHYKKVKDYAFY